MRRLAILLALVSYLSCGCATLIRGTTQEIRIDSYPPGASGEVDGMSIQTPARLMLKRNTPHTVVLRKEGYKPFRTKIEKRFTWTPFLMDLIFWKVLGSEELTAGAWTLRPDYIYASLEIEEASLEELLEKARILLVQSPSEEKPEGASPEEPPLILPAVFRVVESAEVFPAPDICHKSLGTLYQGASIVVLEEKGNWYRLSCTQFPDGWILKSVVEPR